jgi:hypothetical protein
MYIYIYMNKNMKQEQEQNMNINMIMNMNMKMMTNMTMNMNMNTVEPVVSSELIVTFLGGPVTSSGNLLHFLRGQRLTSWLWHLLRANNEYRNELISVFCGD